MTRIRPYRKATLQTRAKAYFVSLESEIHNARWVKVLSYFFREVEFLLPSQISSKKTDGTVFSTPIDKVSIPLSRLISSENHIALSNGLDMMGQESAEFLRQNLELLSSLQAIWVDTNWALGVLRGIGLTSVSRVPWGLYSPSAKELGASHYVHEEVRGSDILLLPRLRSDLYQPKVIFDALEISKAWARFSRIFAIGVHPDYLRGVSESLMRSITVLPGLSESELIHLTRQASMVLMAPKSDGISITALQSIALGALVVSTPTIGALELASKTDRVTCSTGFDAISISDTLDAVTGAARMAQVNDETIFMLNRDFNLKSNVSVALSQFFH